jgi:hypothetical protein
MSTLTTNKSILKPAYNEYASNSTGWSGPINNDWDIIDAAFGGTTIKNPTGVSGTVALTASEYQKLNIVFGTDVSTSAVLTANIIYTIPAGSMGVGGQWVVYNNTTGAFTITIAPVDGTGSSVVIPQGSRSLIYSDGTNINFITSGGSSVPTGGGVDAIFYNNGKTVMSDYTIPASQNSGTFGPVTINTGVTVTVPSGSTWSIV